ncbi:hypothetical protein MAE02_06440 [Microvirga aerophila]|uniref:Uncharacterized protein n=1 Tax=Microvirga aerophila TaxID=670291 RepID=A0A512BLZ5_9HYPH|nr:hypothetical protein MAE02_06440 [Microvirga aerophila]
MDLSENIQITGLLQVGMHDTGDIIEHLAAEHAELLPSPEAEKPVSPEDDFVPLNPVGIEPEDVFDLLVAIHHGTCFIF